MTDLTMSQFSSPSIADFSIVAPEIIVMEGGGIASDIWSLGCTVIELFTGSPPYFELSTMQALFNIVEDKHPPIPLQCSQVFPPPPFPLFASLLSIILFIL